MGQRIRLKLSVMRHLLFSLFLLCSALSASLARQPHSNAKPQDADRAKAQIWYTTACYIWEIKPDKAPKPKPSEWHTVDEFKKWYISAPGKSDKSGFISLKNKVFGENQSYEIAQLVDTIVSKVSRDRNELSSVKSSELRKRLDALPEIQADLKAKKVTAKSSAHPSEPPIAPVDTDAMNPTPIAGETTGRKADNTTDDDLPKEYAWYWMFLVGSLGLVSGFVAGFFIAKRPPNSVQPTSTRTPSASPDETTTGNGLLLQKQLDEAKKRHEELRSKETAWKQLEADLQAELNRVRQLLEQNTTATSAPVEALYSTPIQQPVAAVAPAPRPKLYASAAPSGFLERVETEPSSRAVLLVEPDPANPDRADFGLNPDVDQVWMIGIGFPAFRDYFEDVSFVGAKNLSAAQAGLLKRQGNGWQVENKARLNVR